LTKRVQTWSKIFNFDWPVFVMGSLMTHYLPGLTWYLCNHFKQHSNLSIICWNILRNYTCLFIQNTLNSIFYLLMSNFINIFVCLTISFNHPTVEQQVFHNGHRKKYLWSNKNICFRNSFCLITFFIFYWSFLIWKFSMNICWLIKIIVIFHQVMNLFF